MIEYSKDADGDKGSLDKFFHDAHVELIERGFVELHLQPGDCTRYRMIITDTPGDWVISLLYVSQQVCLVAKSIIVADPKLMEWKNVINAYTRALAAEVLNSVRSAAPMGSGLHYNWEASEPRYG